ncbi:hypothetical protein [Methylorubrum aminovorans]|uniref:hypothetical protein n=1 Tax=Methylorubrum aminovorans TaxID=269069 RepID=UPI003C2FEB57
MVLGQLAAYLQVSGGVLNILGGSLEQQGDAPAAETTGGILKIANTYLNVVPTQARATPFLFANGGELQAIGNTATNRTSGNGNLIRIATDRGDNVVQDNYFGGWGLALPAGPLAGAYGPNVAIGGAEHAREVCEAEHRIKLTGTLNGSGNATVPHGIAAGIVLAANQRILNVSVVAISGSARYPYPFVSPCFYDNTNVSISGGGAGFANLQFEAVVRFR